MLALVLHQVIVFFRQKLVLDQISNWPDIRPFPENKFNIRLNWVVNSISGCIPVIKKPYVRSILIETQRIRNELEQISGIPEQEFAYGSDDRPSGSGSSRRGERAVKKTKNWLYVKQCSIYK